MFSITDSILDWIFTAWAKQVTSCMMKAERPEPIPIWCLMLLYARADAGI